MDKTTLYKFFASTATADEKKAVREWLDADPAHEQLLKAERSFWDAVHLAREPQVNRIAGKKPSGKRSFSLRSLLREAVKAAAVVALTLAAGHYVYHQRLEEIGQAVNTLTIPAGQRANLVLPDGTSVWLNARTEIRYPAVFTGDTREVELKGEAYFDVKHSDRNPFIVHTAKYDVQVYGTKFNVEAYEDEDHFSTALMEGSVKVASRTNPSDAVLLKPRYLVYADGGPLTMNPIEDYDLYCWKDGLICFKNTDFIRLMRRFEKCYGIDIVIANPQLADHVFSGKFRISDGIDNALRVLQREARYTFTRNSDNSVIYIK